MKRILIHALAVLVVLVISSSPVMAQGFPSSSIRSADSEAVPTMGNQPIAVGPFLFSPGLQLSWEDHSNLWQQADRPVEDEITVARVRLLFEVPVRESFVRISYTPQYRESKNNLLHNQWDHFLEISGDFEFSNGLILGAAYRLVDGDVSTDEVDPGGELLFSGRRFSKHQVHLNSSYWLTYTDGLNVDVMASKVEWRGRKQPWADGWFDYNQTSVRAGWLHQTSPTLVMDVSLGYRDYSPEDPGQEYREYTANSVSVGFKGQLNDVLSTELRLGFEETDFPRAASAAGLGFEEFSGFTASGNVTWSLAHGSKIRLDLLRQPFASNYDVNSYYTATGARLLYDLDIGRVYGQLRFRTQENDYDVPDAVLGVKRKDDWQVWGGGLGFRFNDKLSARVSYVHEDRDSLERYGYLNKVWLFDLVFGY